MAPARTTPAAVAAARRKIILLVGMCLPQLGACIQARRHRTQATRATATDLMKDGRSHWASYGDVVYERVRDSYDRVAERYLEEIGGELAGKPLDRALLRCLIELVADVEETTGTGAVADLGSGPGHVAAYLAAQGVTAIAIDISPAMVEV